jgi:N,N'-diacetyllegionaminate synthase
VDYRISHFKSCFTINKKKIGETNPCFIVAEAGVSHFGDIKKAFQLVDAAVKAGADSVKFQHFNTAQMISSTNREWIDRMKSRQLPISAFREIKDYCTDKGITFFATAHDMLSLKELMGLDLPCIKIGSGELQNPEFYRAAASFKKPVIASTGMFMREDVVQIVEALAAGGCTEAALMHCVTSYPVAPGDANLKMISTLKGMFTGPVGYSDHTATPDIAASSVLLGAHLIEKHITLEKNIPNAQDWKVACTPPELVEFVASVRRLEAARGDGEFRLTAGEQKSREWARKSIVASTDIGRGEAITREKILFKRPGTGIAPSEVNNVIGRKAKERIEQDAIITWGQLT